MNKKELIQGILVLIVTIIIFLIILEIGLRVSDNQQQPSKAEVLCIHETGNFVPYKLKPNSETRITKKEFDTNVTTNSLGFRDTEPLSEVNYRAIGVGDSFTFGWGVENEDAYLNVAETNLNDLNKVEIINAGVGGYNNIDSFNYVKEFDNKIDYNLLIFAIFIGNDIADNLEDNIRFVRDDGCLGRNEKPTKPSTIQGTREFFYQNFYVVRFFSQLRYVPIINQVLVWAKIGTTGENNQNFNLFRLKMDSQTALAYEKTKNVTQQAINFSREKNRDFLVVLIPSKYQVYESIFFKDAQKYLVDENEVNIRGPNTVLGNFFNENKISYFDATQSLKDAASKTNEAFYYEIDGHLTKAGQKALGEALAITLREKIKN